jgi:hypothetical protein
MRQVAPSIFANSPLESRFERSQPIDPNVEPVDQEGVVLVGVKQSAARDEGRAAFTNHSRYDGSIPPRAKRLVISSEKSC